MGVTQDRLEQELALWRSAGEAERAGIALRLLQTAETLLATPAGPNDAPPWIDYLETTSRTDFLTTLDSHELRYRWADTSFGAIRRAGYTLETMLEQRSLHQGDHIYLQEYGTTSPARWSFSRIHRRVRSFAATFLAAKGSEARVAILSNNSVDSACTDLACLAHDILVTPLNIHFDEETLLWIFNRLSITVAVVDTEERLRRLLEVRRRAKTPFLIYSLAPNRHVEKGEAVLLGEAVTRLTPDEIDRILTGRPRRGVDEIGTVMFTSGSTGQPKGVAFSTYNLVSKRFARAAALPAVGKNELLLCYLPLYHTFGRYLELLGMLFWGGTYVFAGNPSPETLMAGMQRLRPTGMISIPLRWEQIRERTIEEGEQASSRVEREKVFRSIVGDRLHWGLSAAGYLDPKVFRFFHRNGVELASGFGMTEATGGITMNPPGEYVTNTVGVPLPGIRVKLTDEGEMWIAGEYVARYLAEEGTGLELAPGIVENGTRWIATGDLFKRLKSGHLTIIDRIKDIYKNNRGQTVAPRKVEQKFTGVPGIKRTFLVGDHRAYNVLLIVTDDDDPVLQATHGQESRRDYFHQIVHAANQDLAPYERVINFALLDRDFDLERGELTPKGSYRRKTIERNFADLIDQLYQSSYVELKVDGLRVRVPRWFFRDLGILEDDIVVSEEGLHDRQRGITLPLRRNPDEPLVQVGDLEYDVQKEIINLGLFARQPRLWLGNPALIAFCPCKEGWDVPLKRVTGNVLLPRNYSGITRDPDIFPAGMGREDLREVNRYIQKALYAPRETALDAVTHLGELLTTSDDRIGGIIRRRLTALARHDEEDVRCLAYRVLLLDEPMPDYSVAFPAFLMSGLSFLNEASIKAISSASFEQRRLEALRQRLHSYRMQLEWPVGDNVRLQFEKNLRLLADFVYYQPEFYKPVRAELASWILHREDPVLADYAEVLLDELVNWFEGRLAVASARLSPKILSQMIVYDDDLSQDVRERLRHLLLDTTFLKQAVMLAFDEEKFDLDQVPSGGIWVSRIQSRGKYQLYRTSVNTIPGKHFDLLVILRQDVRAEAVRDTNHWMMIIAGHPYGQRVMPRFGCARPELGAMALEFVNELTVWDKIREFSSVHMPNVRYPEATDWRKLYIRAMATYFQAWSHSERRIVPGTISPTNVVVPELDFREGALILSLAGWTEYRNTFSLFRPLIATFYLKTQAHFPWCGKLMRYEWVFDAAVEALGVDEAVDLLQTFRREVDRAPVHPFDANFLHALDRYLDGIEDRYYVPLPLQNAVARYHAWEKVNPQVTTEAKADLIDGLLSLYRLDRFGEIARYYLYRYTYFSDTNEEAEDVFDRLLDTLHRHPDQTATQLVELSDLQAALTSAEDRDIFSRLVFPQAHKPLPLEVMTVGESEHKQVIVRTQVVDANGEVYDLREPIEPEEIGQLYRLFFQEHFPKMVSEQDRYLIAMDGQDRVIGGITYKLQEREVSYLDGLVVTTPLKSRGIASGILEDFVTRMAGRGVKVVKTGFLLRNFYEKRGFRVDRRWGGLVRFLTEDEPGLDDIQLAAHAEG